MHMSCLSAQSGAADEYKNIAIKLECFEQTTEIDVHGEASLQAQQSVQRYNLGLMISAVCSARTVRCGQCVGRQFGRGR